jgi:hypothetical protein
MADSDELKKIKKDYEKIRKKYNLPPFDKLDREFEIRFCPPEGFILKECRRALSNKLKVYIQILDPVLSPHAGSLHSMIESDGFDEDEKKALFELYKKLGFYIHKSIVAGLQDEQAEADFINEVWKIWPSLKEEVTKFSEKATNLWKINDSKVEEAEYMG